MVPPSHRERAVDGGFMADQWSWNFLFYLWADAWPTIDWKYVYSRMVYTWLTLWNRILPSGGCLLSEEEGRIPRSPPSIRLEFLVFRAVELWAGLGAAVGRGGHGFRRYKVMRFSRCFSNFLQREELALLLKCEV